jgi:uncharacterized membrane protein YidH (DUF202 family)
MSTTWIIKLLLAHLLTDFVFQPKKWVTDRKQNHFRSPYLYWHSLLTGAAALVFAGFSYWPYAIAIFVTHFFIDAWKSYRPDTILYFAIDQVLHLLVILTCWYFIFFTPADLQIVWDQAGSNVKFWILITAYTLLSFPAGILIGQLTKKWSDRVPNNKGLADAGRWIGILERIIILTFLLLDQYAAIGLLITAKGLLRFNEKESQEEKTEYVLIGSLLSISIALLIGILVRTLLTSNL